MISKFISKNSSNKNKILFFLQIISIFIIFVFYLSPYGHLYNPYRVDDTWFTSFIYNDYIKNITTDTVFGGNVKNGLGGTHYFGKLYSFSYGLFADLYGSWSKSSLYIVSIFLLILSSFTWFFIARKLSYSVPVAFTVPLLMLIMPIFFIRSHSIRTEMFVLFFISISTLFLIYEMYSGALLAGFIAVETHPVGLIFLFISVPIFLSKITNKKISRVDISAAMLVSIACIAIYFMLHPDGIKLFSEIDSSTFHLSNNFIFEYYFSSKNWHTLPEFLLVFIASILYTRGFLTEKNNGLLGGILLCIILFSILLNRSTNGIYIVLAYPIFILIMVHAYHKKLPLFIAIIIFLSAPKLAYLSWQGLKLPDYRTEYKDKLLKIIPNDNLPVVGTPNDYWIFKDKEFYDLCHYMDYEKFRYNIHTAWLIIRPKAILEKYYGLMNCKNYENNIEKNYSISLLSSFEYDDGIVEIKKIVKK